MQRTDPVKTSIVLFAAWSPREQNGQIDVLQKGEKLRAKEHSAPGHECTMPRGLDGPEGTCWVPGLMLEESFLPLSN